MTAGVTPVAPGRTRERPQNPLQPPLALQLQSTNLRFQLDNLAQIVDGGAHTGFHLLDIKLVEKPPFVVTLLLGQRHAEGRVADGDELVLAGFEVGSEVDGGVVEQVAGFVSWGRVAAVRVEEDVAGIFGTSLIFRDADQGIDVDKLVGKKTGHGECWWLWVVGCGLWVVVALWKRLADVIAGDGNTDYGQH